jgi:uncharacterized protein (TIGR02268 family)
MESFPSCRAVLLAVLVASEAMAQDGEPRVRNLYLSDDPRDAVPRLYVSSRVATVLRFEQDVKAAGTKMIGWEGWFEPLLVGGQSVLLVPLQKIAPEDRFLLEVTLADGTEQTFIVTALESGRVDQQVNVFPDPESSDAVRSRLSESHRRERVLLEENKRYRMEEISIDHALAALLVRGAVEMTPFLHQRTWRVPCDGTQLEVRHFLTREGDKTALVFHVENQDPDKPWKLMETRMVNSATGKEWPFAMRTDRAEIAPGSSGTIAVVADLSAFDFKKGAENLVLQLVRSDGLMVASVTLEEMLVRK